MVKIAFPITTIAVCLSGVHAFTPSSPFKSTTRVNTETSMKKNDFDLGKAAASTLTAGLLFTNLFVDVAEAFAPDFGDSSTVIAARSGGRAGGRASAGRASSGRTVMNSAPPSRTTVINQAPPVIVAPPPVMVAPPVVGYGYGYNPMPGLGLGLGINAIEGVANGIRESGQERELARNRAELETAKMREADLEARLRALEYQQRQSPQN